MAPGRKPKDLAKLCNQVCKNNPEKVNLKPFLLEGRLKMLEEILGKIDFHVYFNPNVPTLLFFCARFVDYYRTQQVDDFDTSSWGTERIPDELKDQFEIPLNWTDFDMIGRNLFISSVPAGKPCSKAQVILLLSDLFFIFGSSEEYEKGLKQHPFGKDEERNVIAQGLNLLRLVRKYLERDFYLDLLCRFEESTEGLEKRNPEASEKLKASIRKMYKKKIEKHRNSKKKD